jgi:hypothetical protein
LRRWGARRGAVAVLVTLSIVVPAVLAGCEAPPGTGGAGSSQVETPQRFIGIEGDVIEYRSLKTATPVKNDEAHPGDDDFEGVPLTEFIGEGRVSGSPREIWIMSSGDGFAVKIAWEGAEKAYVAFSGMNGWSIVAPEHPVSANAQDVDRIIVVSDDSKSGLRVVREDGSRDVVSFGVMLTSPMRLSYHLDGKADAGEGEGLLSSEVYSRETSFALADVYEPYTSGAFEVTTADGDRYLTDGGGRFSVHRQVIDYIEATGDVYENVAGISFRSEEARTELSEFLFFGDMQPETSISEYEDVGRLVEGAVKANPTADLALQAGDMTNSESPEEWEAFMSMLDSSLDGLPVMTTPGNHEFSSYLDEPGRMPE